MTARQLGNRKVSHSKIVMLTCYDYPTARRLDTSGVDVLLVGDSVGTNVLGYSTVKEVTMEDMVHHCAAVSRGTQNAFILCDMPFGSFADKNNALENARRLMAAGADGIKIEGEGEVAAIIAHVAAHEIPVCAHIGYTPQKGGPARVQGKDLARGKELVDAALAVQEAGAFMLVLELITGQIAREITSLVSIPTIGIGAGADCDGQVQVVLDVLGLSERTFRHARAFADCGTQVCRAAEDYVTQVRQGRFPTSEQVTRMDEELARRITEWIAREKKVSSTHER